MSVVSHCLADTATRGVAMVPKLVLDVMSCEVMRVLQLTDSCIVPISYQVPRKVCARCTYTQSRYAGNVRTSLLCCSNPAKYVCAVLTLSTQARSFMTIFTQTLWARLPPCLLRSGGREETSR